MLRKLAPLLLPLALIAACSSDNKNNSGSPAPQPTTMAQSTTITGTSNPGANSATGKLFSALNPLELLNTAASGQPTQGVADPSLKTPLLAQNDLPSGFIALGDSTYNVPSQFGDLQLAASMFSSGDTASNQFGAIVLSAVVALPPDALDKLGNPSDWAKTSEADLQAVRNAIGQTGVGLSDLRVLDASSLGEGGLGMHMTMDLGALLSAFGASNDGSNPVASGIAIDMYLFVRGDHLLMTMVMWAADKSPGVDGRALAEVMDGKAVAAPASR